MILEANGALIQMAQQNKWAPVILRLEEPPPETLYQNNSDDEASLSLEINKKGKKLLFLGKNSQKMTKI